MNLHHLLSAHEISVHCLRQPDSAPLATSQPRQGKCQYMEQLDASTHHINPVHPNVGSDICLAYGHMDWPSTMIFLLNQIKCKYLGKSLYNTKSYKKLQCLNSVDLWLFWHIAPKIWSKDQRLKTIRWDEYSEDELSTSITRGYNGLMYQDRKVNQVAS